MKKEEIINELNKLRLDKNDFWVLGSSSLVLRDILTNANDIDIAVTSKGYEYLKSKYNIKYLGDNNNYKWYKLTALIEFCVDEKNIDKVEIKEPYNLLNLNYYYNNILKDSTREKDQEKKRIVEQIIKNNFVNF